MIEVTVHATEPLSLGVGPEAGNIVDSYALVPGAVLRGSLAALWFRQHGGPPARGADRDEFIAIFEGDIRFGPLMAENSSVAPMSVVHCKYRPRADCLAAVFDEAAGEVAPPLCACDGPVEFHKGEVVGAPVVKLTSTRLTERETAATGDLFSRRALPAGTVLTGFVHGDHPWLRTCDGERVWLGGRRSVGGGARLTIRSAPEPKPPVRADGLVSIRLLSPGIFVDRATRPSSDFPVGDIAALLGCDAVADQRKWWRPVRVGGWHLASGLPKPQELALAAGSTVLVKPSGPVEPAALAALEQAGLGLRRREGFGAIAVNAPAWRPPVVAATTPDEEAPAIALLALLRPALEVAGLRSWLVGKLREQAIAIEAGRAGTVGLALAERRLRPIALAVREVIGTALRLPDPEVLSDLVALLEDPGPPA